MRDDLAGSVNKARAVNTGCLITCAPWPLDEEQARCSEKSSTLSKLHEAIGAFSRIDNSARSSVPMVNFFIASPSAGVRRPSRRRENCTADAVGCYPTAVNRRGIKFTVYTISPAVCQRPIAERRVKNARYIRNFSTREVIHERVTT